MVVVIQVIYRILSSAKRIQQVRPFTLHCSLLLLIFAYALVGGVVFNRLEAEATEQHHRREWQSKADCVYKTLEHAAEPLGEPFWPRNVTAEHILLCFRTEPDHRSQWSLITATLYGFGIVTTLGYNRIAPITLAGRLFCVFYGICGIPMTMIIIANIGQYLNQFAGATRKNIEAYRERRRRSRVSISGEDIPESSIEFMSLGLLLAFLLWICVGAVLLTLLNGELDFLNGIYFNFLCLTAIDFGQLVPSRWAHLPITFLYVCIGLAITTIAIEIGSEYLKKLHHFGKKMKNVAQTRIWFGGKTLRVKDLLHAVGKKCGIDPAEIDKLDLENVVERAVAMHEGREPPPDTNEDQQPAEEEEPPKEPQPPPPTEQKPLLDEERKRPRTPPVKRAAQRFLSGPTVERASPLDEHGGGGGQNRKDLHLDLCEFVAIDMDLPDGPAEQALAWMDPPKLVMRPRPELVQPDPGIASPTELWAQGPPQVLLNEEQRMLDLEPRKFKEKKEKYGRDAKKLYETYQEEWDRLEKFADRRLGPRRKSVLALDKLPAGGGGSTSPSPRTGGRESSLEGGGLPPSSSSNAIIAGGGPSPSSAASHSPGGGQPAQQSSLTPSPINRRASSYEKSNKGETTNPAAAEAEGERKKANSSSGGGGGGTTGTTTPTTTTPAAVVSPPPWRRANNTFSPPPWRKAAAEGKEANSAGSSRASASPQVLRPPERESRERRASTPRKLSFTKFAKFGDMVTQPQVPGLEERLEERRKSRVCVSGLSSPDLSSRKSLTPSTPRSGRKN